MAGIGELRESIERRLHEALEEADRLRAALAALDGGPSAPRLAQTASSGPEASAPRRRRAPRGSVRQAVLDALSDGRAMTPGEVALTSRMNRTTVASTLTRLLKDGTVTKAARGYQLPSPPVPAGSAGAGDRALQTLRAELGAGLRTRSGP